jgi:acetyl esterase
VSTAAPTASRVPSRRNVIQKVLLILGACVALALALVTLGAFTPDIPVLGVVGAALSGTAPWMGATALVIVLISVWLVIRRRSVLRIVLGSIAAATVVGCTVISAQLVAVGSEHGVSLNPFAVPSSSREPDRTVQYATHDGDPLHVSVWTPDEATGDAPVAFFTHGGGWVSGDPSLDLAGMLSQLSDAGWLVVSAEYTLATPEHHTSEFVEDQIGCAMAWTTANASEFGADPSTFISMGESAGGNLAINTAYRSSSGDLTCDSTGEMPAVDGVVTLFPGVSPYGLYEDPIAGGMLPGRTFMEQYIGGSPAQFPEQYQRVSSSTHLDATSPPTLIFQGEHDHLVQAPRVYDFVDETTRAGVDTTLVRVPFGEHGFPLLPLGGRIYTDITMQWLEDRGLTP